HEELGLEKKIGIAKSIRQLTKKDMKLNGETPLIEVDPQTYEVKVDGEIITCEPDKKVSLAQRYFLF
ncbi:MAG TPA: urease subunit alpha, partial [Metabacillus sp.]|nr:urease subunit alpha [Metabacillus sp.]